MWFSHPTRNSNTGSGSSAWFINYIYALPRTRWNRSGCPGASVYLPAGQPHRISSPKQGCSLCFTWCSRSWAFAASVKKKEAHYRTLICWSYSKEITKVSYKQGQGSTFGVKLHYHWESNTNPCVLRCCLPTNAEFSRAYPCVQRQIESLSDCKLWLYRNRTHQTRGGRRSPYRLCNLHILYLSIRIKHISIQYLINFY